MCVNWCMLCGVCDSFGRLYEAIQVVYMINVVLLYFQFVRCTVVLVKQCVTSLMYV